MKTLLAVSRGIDWLIEGIGTFVNWIVTLMILIGFFNVVARYVGSVIQQRLTSNSLIETQWYMFSIMFLLGFAYVLKHNVNVRVDFLYSEWPPKRRAWVDLIGTLVFLIPLCIIAIYVAWGPVLSSWGRLPNGSWGEWETSPDPDGLPRAPIRSMIIVGFALLLLQSVSQIIKYVAILTDTLSKEEAEKVEEYHAFEEVHIEDVVSHRP